MLSSSIEVSIRFLVPWVSFILCVCHVKLPALCGRAMLLILWLSLLSWPGMGPSFSPPPSCQCLAFFPQKCLPKCPWAEASRWAACLLDTVGGKTVCLLTSRLVLMHSPLFNPHPQPLLCLPPSAERPLIPFFLNMKLISLESRGYLGRDLPLSDSSSQGRV